MNISITNNNDNVHTYIFFKRYLGVDHVLKWIVLSVRGTLNSTDILTDLTVSATPLGGGHVHRGVLEASLRLFAVIVVRIYLKILHSAFFFSCDVICLNEFGCSFCFLI
jgi:hypothetical protein